MWSTCLHIYDESLMKNEVVQVLSYFITRNDIIRKITSRRNKKAHNMFFYFASEHFKHIWLIWKGIFCNEIALISSSAELHFLYSCLSWFYVCKLQPSMTNLKGNVLQRNFFNFVILCWTIKLYFEVMFAWNLRIKQNDKIE